MGRKAEITAVPIEQKEESLTCGDDEVKTDAQHMTDIINEVNAPVQEEVPIVEDTIEAPVAVAKPKAKRASRSKPAVEVVPATVDDEVAEPAVEVEEPVEAVEVAEEPKVDTKVACPDCGKQMSAKTLKYSHGPNCSAKKQKQEVEDQRDEEESQPNIVRNPLTEAILDNWKETRCTRLARAVRRQEMVDRLIQNAF